jgi:Ribonuclease G/E
MEAEALAEIVGRLETPCEECGGKGIGEPSYYRDAYPCARCDGTGHVLTDAGEALFAFIERLMERRRFRS